MCASSAENATIESMKKEIARVKYENVRLQIRNARLQQELDKIRMWGHVIPSSDQ